MNYAIAGALFGLYIHLMVKKRRPWPTAELLRNGYEKGDDVIYADTIKVDTDEGEYLLVIDTDEGETLYVNIHRLALDFYANVQAELRPYVLEAEGARAALIEPVNEFLGGYDLDDPKHPTFHERMAD